MKPSHVLVWALILTAVTFFAVFVIDGPVAFAVVRVAPALGPVINALTGAVEVLFAFPLSKFASGAVVLLASIVLFFFRLRRSTAWLLLFVSLSQLTTRLVAGVLKKRLFASAAL